jgi:hypothetical protein
MTTQKIETSWLNKNRLVENLHHFFRFIIWIYCSLELKKITITECLSDISVGDVGTQ